MDLRDVQIISALMQECRIPLRVIATRLGVSVAAVHQRLSALEESGVIQAYRCLANPALFNASIVQVTLKSNRPATRSLCDSIGSHPAVFQIFVASHDHVSITAVVRGQAELDEVQAHVCSLVDFHTPHVREFDEHLCDESLEFGALESGIAHALSFKARRPISELGRKLLVSDKVVRRRLDQLVAANAILFTLTLDPGVSGNPWSLLTVESDGSRTPTEILDELSGDQAPHVLCTHKFRDTTIMQAYMWSPTSRAMETLRERLLEDDAVTRVTTGVVVASFTYPVWIHGELEQQLAGAS